MIVGSLLKKAVIHPAETKKYQGVVPAKEIDKIYCRYCGKLRQTEGEFCSICGRGSKALSTTMKECPNCNSSVSEDSLFCSSCGSKIQKATS